MHIVFIFLWYWEIQVRIHIFAALMAPAFIELSGMKRRPSLGLDWADIWVGSMDEHSKTVAVTIFGEKNNEISVPQ